MKNIHELIEHIMDNSVAKTFCEYLKETYQLFEIN
jgi:hypothetical protein